MGRLVIEPLAMHWLFPEAPAEDLCAHGGVRISFDGRVLLEEKEPYAVSTGALHLLRSLEPGYKDVFGLIGGRLASQLIPCCGHAMQVDPKTGKLENIGCGDGVGCGIEHISDAQVRLTFANEVVMVSRDEWREAVVAYSALVRAFYFAGPPKRTTDSYDAEWLSVMLDEWAQRHEAAQRA